MDCTYINRHCRICRKALLGSYAGFNRWMQFRGPNIEAHSGGKEMAVASIDSEIVELPVGSFATSWKLNLPLSGQKITNVALTDDTVFVSTSAGRVFWVDRSGGTIRTITTVARAGERIFDPVISGERVIIPTEQKMIAFTPEGKRLYDIKLRYNCSSPVVGDAMRVYAGVDHPTQGRVEAISADEQIFDVLPVWDQAVRGHVSARPALRDGMLFAASSEGYVYAITAENRSLLWPGQDGAVFQTGAEITADLAVDGDGVYVSSGDTKLYCLNPFSGQVKWIFYAGAPLKAESAPVPIGRWVYVYVPGSGLAAIEKGEATTVRRAKWIIPEGRKVVAADDKMTYLAMADGSIGGVDRATGLVTMHSSGRGFAAFGANVNPKSKEPGIIYAASPDGTLVAVKPISRPGTVGEMVVAPSNSSPMFAAR